MKVFNVSDVVESNRKTIRENNLNIPHSFEVGDLVEINFDEYDGMRMYIVKQSRDCDGSPLYSLGTKEIKMINGIIEMHGFGEESLRRVGEVD